MTIVPLYKRYNVTMESSKRYLDTPVKHDSHGLILDRTMRVYSVRSTIIQLVVSIDFTLSQPLPLASSLSGHSHQTPIFFLRSNDPSLRAMGSCSF